MKYVSQAHQCVADYLTVRFSSLENACTGGGVCTYCEGCFFQAKTYLQQCRANGIEPDRESQDIYPESQTPLWDLRDYINEVRKELDALRPAFGDMLEFRALESEAEINMDTVMFILN